MFTIHLASHLCMICNHNLQICFDTVKTSIKTSNANSSTFIGNVFCSLYCTHTFVSHKYFSELVFKLYTYYT